MSCETEADEVVEKFRSALDELLAAAVEFTFKDPDGKDEYKLGFIAAIEGSTMALKKLKQETSK